MMQAMLRLRDAGYDFVMVTNQDGPRHRGVSTGRFRRPACADDANLCESQGIRFRDVLMNHSFPHENSSNRKPALGLMQPLLRDRSIDWARSAMVGDRETDIQFAENLDIRGFKLKSPQFGDGVDWAHIAHVLVDVPRTATIERKTKETRIVVEVDLDREAEPDVKAGLGFYDHMLEQLGEEPRRFRAAVALRRRSAYRRAPHRRGLRVGAGTSAASGAGRQARHRALQYPADG